MTARKCPNCTSLVANHPENGCVLAALIGVLRDRGGLSERALRDLHACADVDALWELLGPIIDDLEEGRFQQVAQAANKHASRLLIAPQ